jgi:hypothetical protein
MIRQRWLIQYRLPVQGDRGADFEQTAAYLVRHKSISKKAGKVKRKISTVAR